MRTYIQRSNNNSGGASHHFWSLFTGHGHLAAECWHAGDQPIRASRPIERGSRSARYTSASHARSAVQRNGRKASFQALARPRRQIDVSGEAPHGRSNEGGGVGSGTLRENRVVIHGGPSACRSHAAKARVPDFQRAMAVFLVP